MKEFNEMADTVEQIQKEIEKIDASLLFFWVSMISLVLWIPIMAITSLNPWVLKWTFAVQSRFWFIIGWWGISLFAILRYIDRRIRR